MVEQVVCCHYCVPSYEVRENVAAREGQFICEVLHVGPMRLHRNRVKSW